MCQPPFTSSGTLASMKDTNSYDNITKTIPHTTFYIHKLYMYVYYVCYYMYNVVTK